MSTSRSAMFDLADRAVDEIAAADPCAATEMGVPGVDDRLTDYSPSGIGERAQQANDLVMAARELVSGPDVHPQDAQAAAVMIERLSAVVGMSVEGDFLRDVNVLASPPQAIRQAFELMAPNAEAAHARMSAVPAAMAGWRSALSEGLRRNHPAARRQALAVADQLQTIGAGWFAEHASQTYSDYESIAAPAQHADEAYLATAQWLRTEYAPRADEADGVGEARYERHAIQWLGDSIDLHETYAWGWSLLRDYSAQIAALAATLGASSPALAKRMLDESPQYTIEGEDNLLEYLRTVTESAIEELDGRYFDIDDRIRTCEVKIAGAGSAAAPYYVPPSEDLSRPGSTWYPTLGRTRFPRWWLLSVWYHESVPGHHLQLGTAILQKDSLSRFQRLAGGTSGYWEGWALYSERLMDELGYFEDPGVEMGYLVAQAMRAARVVIDIGLHLGMPIGADAGPKYAGLTWTPELAEQVLVDEALLEPDFARSEVNRYLGLPGQAISYKVGERVWLAEREAAQQRLGDGFDLRQWHMYALRAGHMGLAPFRSVMDGFGR